MNHLLVDDGTESDHESGDECATVYDDLDAAPVIVSLTLSSTGLTHSLPHRMSILGRSGSADVCLPELTRLSMKHFAIEVLEATSGPVPHVLVEDLSSRNGTVLVPTGQQPMALQPNRWYRVHDGDRIRAGGVDFVVGIILPAPPMAPPPAPPVARTAGGTIQQSPLPGAVSGGIKPSQVNQQSVELFGETPLRPLEGQAKPSQALEGSLFPEADHSVVPASVDEISPKGQTIGATLLLTNAYVDEEESDESSLETLPPIVEIATTHQPADPLRVSLSSSPMQPVVIASVPQPSLPSVMMHQASPQHIVTPWETVGRELSPSRGLLPRTNQTGPSGGILCKRICKIPEGCLGEIPSTTKEGDGRVREVAECASPFAPAVPPPSVVQESVGFVQGPKTLTEGGLSHKGPPPLPTPVSRPTTHSPPVVIPRRGMICDTQEDMAPLASTQSTQCSPPQVRPVENDKKGPEKRTRETAQEVGPKKVDSVQGQEQRQDIHGSSPKRIRRVLLSPLLPPKRSMSVAISGWDMPIKVRRRLESVVGFVFGSHMDCTHLVVDDTSPKRTIKLLCALSVTDFVVTKKWLIKCYEEGMIVDWGPYIVRNTEMEDKHKFNIVETLARAKKARETNGGRKILSDVTVFVTKGVIPQEKGGDDLKEVLVSLGATLQHLPKSHEIQVVVAVKEDVADYKKRRGNSRSPVVYVNTEWVFNCAMQQAVMDTKPFEIL